MTAGIVVAGYTPPPPEEREIWRYAGCKAPDGVLAALLGECLAETAGIWQYRVCYGHFPVNIAGDAVDLGFADVVSRDLANNMAGCRRACIFAATVGLELDRLLRKYSRLSPAKAVLLQAIGAERIEALCDTFCEAMQPQWQGEGLVTKPRFSPGYGDLPMALQRDIFRVLDCPGRIGVSLNNSLLMTPTKSVTAIIGLKEG